MRRFNAFADRVGFDPKALLGLLAIAASILLIVATYTGLLRNLVHGSKPEVTATFTNVATLHKGDPVRVKGVDVGTVKKLEPVDGGRATKVTLAIDKSAGPVYRDARAKVAWRTLLGGAFAVNVDTGHADAGSLPATGIPLSQTQSQVELDDVTTVVQGQAERGLRQIPPSLSAAMHDPQTLATLARTLGGASPSIEHGLNALRGVDKARDLDTLIVQTSRVAQALNAPDDALRGLVQGAGGTLQTTARREADLRATIAEAPRVLGNTDRTLAALDTTLDVVDPLVARLREPAGHVAPALAELRPVLGGASRLLIRATPLLRDLRPSVRSLASAARQGVPLLDDVDPSLVRLDRTILPYMNETDPETQHSAAEMVGPALGGLGNVAAQYDQNGHVLRFPFSSGSSPFYLPCQVYAGNPDKAKLLECRSLQELATAYTTYDPFGPAPQTSPPPPPSTTTRKSGGK